MKLIQSYTVASSTNSVTFTSIDQTYTDLLVKFSLRSDYGFNSHEGNFTFNSLTSGYGQTLFVGDGSSVNTYGPQSNEAQATWGIVMNGSISTSNTFSTGDLYFYNYSNTGVAKTWATTSVTENNASAAATWLVAGSHATTAAISSITFYAWQSFINFVPGSTFYLYGIKKS